MSYLIAALRVVTHLIALRETISMLTIQVVYNALTVLRVDEGPTASYLARSGIVFTDACVRSPAGLAIIGSVSSS